MTDRDAFDVEKQTGFLPSIKIIFRQKMPFSPLPHFG
jgi:hypothetical protein